MEPAFSGLCRCRCGEVRLRLLRPPLTRYYCHCDICQRVHRLAYADTTVAWGSQVEVADPAKILFQRQRSIPFSVRCGTCLSCHEPVLGYTAVLPFLDLALVPGSALLEPADLPAAAAHLFYGRRATDVRDDLPRYHGFAASELGFARLVVAGIARSLHPQGHGDVRRYMKRDLP